ncbi:MAG: hypothetical protein NTZ35_10545 [Ignavibacteriales bacterium]|nr:hypothetical protein [Ignavibacteriales bacterium]
MRTRNKLGLVLSDGGFRVSFFHIGVLARLAEFDLLRSVEVISNLSSGSMNGKDLRVNNLLESTHDNTITHGRPRLKSNRRERGEKNLEVPFQL